MSNIQITCDSICDLSSELLQKYGIVSLPLYVRVGDEVELFGEHNSLCALSDAAGTIPYELLCAVSKRVPRVY